MGSIPLAALSVQPPPNPLDQASKLMQLRSLAQQQQYQQQAQPLALQQQGEELKTAQYANQQRAAMDAAYKKAVTVDQNGQPNIDTDVLQKSLADAGHGSAIPGILENVTKFQKSKADLTEATQKIQSTGQDMAGNLAKAIQQANYDPSLSHTLLDTLPQGNPKIQELRQLIDGNPSVFKQHVDAAVNSSGAQQKMMNEQAVAKIRAGGSGDNPLADKVPQLNQALTTLYQAHNPGKPLPPELSLQPNATQKDYDRIEKVIQAAGQAKESEANAASSQALKQAALASTQQTQSTNRAEKSYQFESGQLEKVAQPIDALATRLGRLQDTIAQNSPQADALVAPELLSVMSGGQGSGLRMNEAEISRIVGGRSKWETLKASINKWQLDPKAALSITPAQRQQIRDLTQTVAQKITAKQSALQDARNGLIGTDDPDEHKKIVAGARQKMTDIDAGSAAQHVAGGSSQGLKEGQTGKGSDGKQYVVKGGTWQLAQ